MKWKFLLCYKCYHNKIVTTLKEKLYSDRIMEAIFFCSQTRECEYLQVKMFQMFVENYILYHDDYTHLYHFRPGCWLIWTVLINNCPQSSVREELCMESYTGYKRAKHSTFRDTKNKQKIFDKTWDFWVRFLWLIFTYRALFHLISLFFFLTIE